MEVNDISDQPSPGVLSSAEKQKGVRT